LCFLTYPEYKLANCLFICYPWDIVPGHERCLKYFWVIKMIPFQGQKQNRQPPDINFLPISGFEPRTSHIMGITSPTMTLSPCRRAMYVSIYPPLHRALRVSPARDLDPSLLQSTSLVISCGRIFSSSITFQHIPLYPKISLHIPTYPVYIPIYPYLYWDIPTYTGITRCLK